MGEGKGCDSTRKNLSGGSWKTMKKIKSTSKHMAGVLAVVCLGFGGGFGNLGLAPELKLVSTSAHLFAAAATARPQHVLRERAGVGPAPAA